jgi:putative phosphoesterase
VAPFAVKRLLAFQGPLHCTYGNNDGERAGLKKLLPQIVDGPLFVELAGRRVLIHHFIDWCKPEDVERADIVITGHTHEVVNHFEGKKLFLNPGECCGWVNNRCTVALLDTDGPSAEVCEIQG